MLRVLHPIDAVRAAGGVARSATLIRQGVAKHEIARATADRKLIRLRRVWLAVPDADPFLVSAARDGVVLTCVTQAARRGLWTLSDGRVHVAAPPHAGMVSAPRATVHRHQPIVPRHPDSLEDPIENVLAMVAACQPHESALAIWDSALHLELADPLALAGYDLSASARRLLAEASAYRDSGLETFAVVRLRFLRLPLVSQVWIAGRPVDVLIGERLVLQIDGGHHVGRQRSSDVEHDARLRLLGYTVIRVTYAQVVDHWSTVVDLILRAVGQGLHRIRP